MHYAHVLFKFLSVAWFESSVYGFKEHILVLLLLLTTVQVVSMTSSQAVADM